MYIHAHIYVSCVFRTIHVQELSMGNGQNSVYAVESMVIEAHDWTWCMAVLVLTHQ